MTRVAALRIETLAVDPARRPAAAAQEAGRSSRQDTTMWVIPRGTEERRASR